MEQVYFSEKVPISSNTVLKIKLESLSDGIPVIPKEAVGFYKQNCMICFNHNGHKSGVSLDVFFGNIHSLFQLFWTGEINNQLLLAYQDLKKAADFAACSIALLLIRELTEYTAIEQSCTGTTIDYYLVSQKQQNDLIFNRSARLEVSGILTENESNTVEYRINQKKQRLKVEADLPDIIVVVEFSRPWSKMVKV